MCNSSTIVVEDVLVSGRWFFLIVTLLSICGTYGAITNNYPAVPAVTLLLIVLLPLFFVKNTISVEHNRDSLNVSVYYSLFSKTLLTKNCADLSLSDTQLSICKGNVSKRNSYQLINSCDQVLVLFGEIKDEQTKLLHTFFERK